MRATTGRQYVSVDARFDEEGQVWPAAIIWKDGRRFSINSVLEQRQACSQLTGEDGTRYRVLVGGRERFLYREGDFWFVDAQGRTRV